MAGNYYYSINATHVLSTLISAWQSDLQKSQNLSDVGVVWTPPEKHHITLRFLGKMANVDLAIQWMNAVALQHAELSISLDGSLNTFFRKNRSTGVREPFCLWATVRPADTIAAIAEDLGNPSLVPHLTLAKTASTCPQLGKIAASKVGRPSYHGTVSKISLMLTRPNAPPEVVHESLLKGM